jgi:hypothetical protein
MILYSSNILMTIIYLIKLRYKNWKSNSIIT